MLDDFVNSKTRKMTKDILIEDYKRKLGNIKDFKKFIEDQYFSEKRDVMDSSTYIRLEIKEGLYRTFLAELSRLE